MTPSPLPPAPPAADFKAAESSAIVCALDGYGVLTVEGSDAAEFLQAQVSSDVRSLAPGTSQLSSYHSAKGRVLANFVLFRTHDEAAEHYVALMRDDLVVSVAKRLSLFVLRAKVKVAARRDLALVGIGGPAAAQVAVVDVDAGANSSGTPHSAVAFPDGRIALAIASGERDAAIAVLAREARRVDVAVFDWLGVRAGVPLIGAALSDQLLPQALNWDVLGGVHFRKGCYPGQEIIARTHYLGRAKERLFAFHAAVPPPAAGVRLYANRFGDQACGMVVNSAYDIDGGSLILAAAQVEAADHDELRLAKPEGTPLAPRTLPYALPAPRMSRDRIA